MAKSPARADRERWYSPDGYNSSFAAQLGFVGTDFGSFGRVAIGKQYPVHYDIASYTTDRFNVFAAAAKAHFAYVAGADGGPTDTGRADRVLQYRSIALNFLDLGV
jgi:predicted porin